MLAFWGQNFYRGIVLNEQLGFQKDVAYDLLENPRYNWRQFLLRLVARVIVVLELLTSDEREKVLVVDDSDYDRSRSKKVELPILCGYSNRRNWDGQHSVKILVIANDRSGYYESDWATKVDVQQ